MTEKKKLFRSGWRSVKTAFACVLCAALYYLFDRNPTFACIGVVFGMGSDMADSKLNGGNRLIGTIIGGLLGMGLFWVYIQFYPDGETRPLIFLMLFVGVLLLIFFSLVFHWPGAVQPGGVVICIILFNTPVETYISYSLNRILDTGIGVLMALLISYFLPHDRLIAWKQALLRRFRKKNDLEKIGIRVHRTEI